MFKMKFAAGVGACVIGSTLALLTAVDDGSRYRQRALLPSGEVFIVAEGEDEPRSIGSVAVRLYSGEHPDHPLDDFRCGVILPRDGAVERIDIQTINGTGNPELVVIMRSAGGGGFLSAYALEYREGVPDVRADSLELVASVRDLRSDEDPITSLRDRVRREYQPE